MHEAVYGFSMGVPSTVVVVTLKVCAPGVKPAVLTWPCTEMGSLASAEVLLMVLMTLPSIAMSKFSYPAATLWEITFLTIKEKGSSLPVLMKLLVVKLVMR